MKGRNSNLIQLRNQHLIRRYYYWHDIKRLRLDDVWETLSFKEIFLDVDYMMHLLRQNHHYLKQLRTAKPKESRLPDFEFIDKPQPELINGCLFQN